MAMRAAMAFNLTPPNVLTIWLALRWNTQTRVARLLSRWKSANHPDRSLNLTAEVLEWMSALVRPIRSSRERLDALVSRAKGLRGVS